MHHKVCNYLTCFTLQSVNLTHEMIPRKMKNPTAQNYHNKKINKDINYSSKSGPEKYSKRHDSG